MDKGLASWLQRIGYVVTFRANSWWECLVSREGERWFGAGATAEDAFADAVAKILPSAAARSAVAEALARSAANPPSGDVSTKAPSVPSPAAGSLDPSSPPSSPAAVAPASSSDLDGAPPGPSPTSLVTASPHPAVDEASDPQNGTMPVVAPSGAGDGASPTPDDDAVAPGPHFAVADQVGVPTYAPSFPEASAATAASRVVTVPVAPAAPVAAKPASPPAPPKERLDPIAAIDEIEQLEHAIRDAYVEASLLVPVRQRLLLTQWMARARAIQEACPHAEHVEERVYALAQRLGKLAKSWWPGTTKVLALDSKPRHCAKDFERVAAPGLDTWRDVEHAAEQELLAEEEDANGRGMDEFGWADGGALAPPPVDPERVFDRVRSLIEQHTAPPLMPPEVAAHTEELKPHWLERDLGRPENWKQALGELRWLRSAGIDPELWGAAMGRLRWMAAHDPIADTALASWLKPAFRPTRSWWVELGHERRERSLRAAKLAGATPPVDASEAVVCNWLAECFALEDGMPIDKLASLAAPLRERIGAIPAGHFAERSHRRRLRSLRDKLGLVPIAATTSDDHAGVRAEAPAHGPAAVDPDGAVRRGHEQAVNRLLPQTRGRRVLIVSNRVDPSRDRQLKDALEFASIDPCVLDASRVRGKEDAVRNGTYDLVLAATGFLPHSVEGVLKGACRQAGVPFVRVSRGRFAACLIGLQRDLRDRLDGVRR